MAENKKIGVYGVRNTTEDMWYIGSSTNIQTRLDTHIKSVKERTGIFSKVHENADFEFKILKELKNDTQLELWENFYIGKYNSIDNGYNKILSSRSPVLNVRRSQYKTSDICIINVDDLAELLKLKDKEDISLLKSIVPSVKIGKSIRFEKNQALDFILNDSFSKFLEGLGLK